ncbi:hypothetical protein I302_104535 [Kwoniella bestiolae CBS 10118]|uniref:SnoaL-like domain-containing protein n=1 Tax=Kwoniella bestiolae CBS 10118 TaxID=1296100 RepID=A0A1B9GBJ2_9TREE|nr:hypothetical protein I302_03241 [Kwoniella bestiolae CBS 10118]OCF28382.1 hypothetical protein I302_03241 [Kwoniella bestiolae CBS 10118]
MPLTKEYVQKIFGHAVKNEMTELFSYLRDDVKSTIFNDEVKASFPAGSYDSKMGYITAMTPLYSILTHDPDIHITRIMIADGNTAIVQMNTYGVGKKDGKRYANPNCYVLEFEDVEENPKIKTLTKYADSAVLQQFYENNKD